ncbi:MAG: hypothetical protein RR553_02395, partial [Akkermansia sp.]
ERMTGVDGIGNGLSMSGAYTAMPSTGGVVQEKKMVLPKKKVTVNIRRKEGEPSPESSPIDVNAEPSMTVGSVDSGSALGSSESSGETLTR